MAALVERLRGSLAKALHGRGFVQSVVLLGGSTALAQGLLVLASPILSRLYTPADYGALAVYTSILAVVSVVASLRYELAIPLPASDSMAANLFVLSLLLVLGTSLLTGLGVFLLGDQIVLWTRTVALKPFLWLLPLGVAGTGIYQVLSYWAVRKKAFGYIARTRLAQSLGQVLTQLSLGLFAWGIVGLLLGHLAGLLAESSALAPLVYRRDRVTMKQVNGAGMGQAAQRYRRFPLLSSGSALLNSVGLQLPPLLLAAFYGPQVAGWFALGRRVISVPMTLIGQAVAQVYLGEASRLVHENPKALVRLFLKTTRRLTLVGSIPVVVLGVVAPLLFGLIFGEPWRQAGVYVRLLALMYAAQFAVVPLSQTLNVLERQDLQLAWDGGRATLVAGSLFLAHRQSWSDAQAIAALGASMFLAYLVLLGLSVYALFRTSQIGARL